MRKSTHRTTTHASAAKRSRRKIVGFLAALAIVAAGLGPAVGVDVPGGDDGDPTEAAFALSHSSWGATWS